MHKFADNNSRLLKWSLKLSEYNFEVQHKPAAQIKHVDTLSRVVQTVSSQHALSREEVKAEQGKDKFCTTLKLGTVKGKTEYFGDEDGLMYRRRKNGEHQLVVPASMVHEVIRLNHDPAFSAHPGRNRTLNLLCVRFYWPGMRRDEEEYVRNCVECQHTNARQMSLPSMQHLNAKLSPEIRNTDHAERLKNLQRNLRMAYKVAREHTVKAHAANKRYYDRSARERVFTQGEYVFLYSPVIKPRRSAKFRRCWSGPWKVLRRKSELTYAIGNKQGKEMTVHVTVQKLCLQVPYRVAHWLRTAHKNVHLFENSAKIWTPLLQALPRLHLQRITEQIPLLSRIRHQDLVGR
jgi:hypothetical protein